jgi:hypothetical protein
MTYEVEIFQKLTCCDFTIRLSQSETSMHTFQYDFKYKSTTI